MQVLPLMYVIESKYCNAECHHLVWFHRSVKSSIIIASYFTAMLQSPYGVITDYSETETVNMLEAELIEAFKPHIRASLNNVGGTLKPHRTQPTRPRPALPIF